MKKLLSVLLAFCCIVLLSGCSKEITVTFIANDQVVYEITDNHKMMLEVPDYQSNEYNFYGWTLEDGTPADFSKEIEESTTFYAKLVKICVVNWENEGVILESKSYEEGDLLEIPEMDYPQSSQDHYVFAKWVDQNGQEPADGSVLHNSITYTAEYEYTMEKIDIEHEQITFSIKKRKVRSGISDNLCGPLGLHITSSNPEVAYFYDEMIYAKSVGEATFRIESPDGRLIRYVYVTITE